MSYYPLISTPRKYGSRNSRKKGRRFVIDHLVGGGWTWAMNGTPKKVFRCAIYTRKSTEHNLDLEFNSLDAQREACEAYIKRRLATLLLFLVVSSGCAVLIPECYGHRCRLVVLERDLLRQHDIGNRNAILRQKAPHSNPMPPIV
jgi:hypothetical protein